MWQFDSEKLRHDAEPDFVKNTSSGKPFSWAVAFLDYEFIAVDRETV